MKVHRTLEVVIARYREPLDWTRHLPRGVAVTVYDKGHDLDPASVPHATVERLPNVGNEAHTYCHHVSTRRDRLADATFFVQGHPFDHAHDLHRVVRAVAWGREPMPDFRWLGFIVDTDDCRGRRLFARWSKNRDGRDLAVDEFFLRLFDAPCPAEIPFYPGGQFAASRDRLLSRPPEFWQRALDLAATFPDGAHCFERLWDRVVGAQGVDPALLADGRKTVYLKPVRRDVSG